MLCAEFEERLTDYLDGTLAQEASRAFAEHGLRCPLCHELLSEVKNTIIECRTAPVPSASHELEARILMQTAPETAMTCEEFEAHLTDYLDGFLPAPLFHRWERHAALCASCTELPGHVVRAIGACYSYISIERALPATLHARILQATLGTTEAKLVRAPWHAQLVEWLRSSLDAMFSPQLATVATMALIAVVVGTSTISDDGSIGGMYRATLRIAAQTYEHGASTARNAALSGDFKRVADGLRGEQAADADAATPGGESNAQPQPATPASNGQQPPQVQEQQRK